MLKNYYLEDKIFIFTLQVYFSFSYRIKKNYKDIVAKCIVNKLYLYLGV